MYMKNDGLMYILDDQGVEKPVNHNALSSNKLGWIQFTDGQFTNVSSLELSDSVRTKLVNDAASVLNVVNAEMQVHGGIL